MAYIGLTQRVSSTCGAAYWRAWSAPLVTECSKAVLVGDGVTVGVAAGREIGVTAARVARAAAGVAACPDHSEAEQRKDTEKADERA